MNEIEKNSIPPIIANTRKTFVKAEVNFLQYPIGTLDKHHKGKTLVYSENIPTKDGIIKVEWKVSAGEIGLPGPSAIELDNVLSKIIQDAARLEGKVPEYISTNFYQLCKALKITHSGKNNRMIWRDLKRLRSATIDSKRAFKKKDHLRPYEDQSFSKYTTAVLRGIESNEDLDAGREYGKPTKIIIGLSDQYRWNLKTHYTKPIDYDFMMSLSNAALERMYQLLSFAFQTRMHEELGGGYINYNYIELCSRMPLKIWDVPSRAKNQLLKYLRRLSEECYISNIELHFKGALDRWFIRIFPGEKATSELATISNQKDLFQLLNKQDKIRRLTHKKADKKSMNGEGRGLNDEEERLRIHFESLSQDKQNAILKRADEILETVYKKSRKSEFERKLSFMTAVEESSAESLI